ncbi:MAG: hypothetical protein A3B96_03515 [Candidatus Spechtbacteria bacterium RIFCSPHIGHO2_02_FULL_43_15b]|uniref:DegT/DnrJ/EryC1/StrS aminotransferase n=1 Tax=Candidatus Spechtbacteria bacterium RIFCSPHIGHO2_01_FULL_43_30 TaxID=1802158 RepID=A0A1G2H5W9_9BACT|nr:MAG: hypothetical protein A2827_00150 [Candidatus Spechtbacteria bacterium RIFCSPHIGHO2_01_FULL_43_30]OGZ59791.1 MAG: hypothetical protein A3B96_03515 [Candidatus Spechtbacteria bacterium RIFCSPHIGHO2_02_FULL_43_15b]
MCQCIKPISISLSPNVQRDDFFMALKILLTQVLLSRAAPKSNSSTKDLEKKFKEYLGLKYAFTFNSGRSCLYAILKTLDIKQGDEVFVQAFTCNAVPNPVLWAGGRPVYVDIDDSLNIDPEDLIKKISLRKSQGKNLRAIIIQNTFGIPAQIDKILEIAKKHNLIVIEDCAHALGAEYSGKKLGTFGDIAFFSFGRDKVISSVWGGVVATNSDEMAAKMQKIYAGIPHPKKSWVVKQLTHPILFSIIIPTYYIFGKYFLGFLRVARGIGLAVSQQERRGEKPDIFPAKMPDALAKIALHQFTKLEKYNEHRRRISKLYFLHFAKLPYVGFPSSHIELPKRSEGAVYLRFNIRATNAKEILKKAKRRHILLGDWYKNVIDPLGTDFEKLGYAPESCPRAEKAAKESINLPTHINISEKSAIAIVKFLQK